MVTKKRFTNGFTMIELLIVIAIVGTVGALMGSSMLRLHKQAQLDNAVAAIAADMVKVASDSKRYNKKLSVRFNSNNSKYIILEDGENNIATKLPNNVYIKKIQFANKSVAVTKVSYLKNGVFEEKDIKVTFGNQTNDNLEATLSIIGVTGRVIIK